MRTGTLGTLTIGQAPRLDVMPIIDRHVPERVRRIHRGVLDGLSHAEIAARYLAEPGEAALVTRLKDGRVAELSRSRMRDGAEQALKRLEADGCDVILILCTGTFEGLRSERAWLVEPDHIIPATVAGLMEKRQLGIIVPIASQIESERDKWRPLARRRGPPSNCRTAPGIAQISSALATSAVAPALIVAM
jgi:protein AroM